MKVIRSNTKLWIEIEEDNDGIEISFPNVARFHYGFAKYEIVADELEHVINMVTHYLALLASNALQAERYAKMTGKPRWLVYNAETGDSYETPHFTEGAPRVEYKEGTFIWTNPEAKYSPL